VSVQAIRHVVGEEVYLHSFLHSILVEGEWLASSPIRLTPKKYVQCTLDLNMM